MLECGYIPYQPAFLEVDVVGLIHSLLKLSALPSPYSDRSALVRRLWGRPDMTAQVWLELGVFGRSRCLQGAVQLLQTVAEVAIG